MVLAPFVLLAASPSFEESFRSGLAALQRNDLIAAISSLENAAKLAPQNGRVWIALSQAYRRQQLNAKAKAAVARAEALAASDALIWKTLSIYYDESGDPLKSAETGARYSALAPNDTAARERAEQIYFALAQDQLRQSKFTEAIAILQPAVKHLKGSAQLQLALGVACYGMRRFDEAADAFLRTAAIDPTLEQPQVFLGKFLGQIPTKLPDVARAFTAFEKANPNNPAGYVRLAKALNAQSLQPDAARALLEKALSMNDRDAVAHFELGTLLEQSRNYEDAARQFESSIALDPNEPATYYRLARVYDRLGRHDAAEAQRKLHTDLEAAQRAGIH